MPGGRIKVNVEVQDFKALRSKLRSDELLGGIWADAMRQVADMAAATWRGAIAVDSGQAQGSIQAKTQARPVPLWALVKVTATRSSAKYKRYRYYRRVEFDPRSRNKGRLTNALKGSLGRVQGILNTVARRIEAKWGA